MNNSNSLKEELLHLEDCINGVLGTAEHIPNLLETNPDTAVYLIDEMIAALREQLNRLEEVRGREGGLL